MTEETVIIVRISSPRLLKTAVIFSLSCTSVIIGGYLIRSWFSSRRQALEEQNDKNASRITILNQGKQSGRSVRSRGSAMMSVTDTMDATSCGSRSLATLGLNGLAMVIAGLQESLHRMTEIEATTESSNRSQELLKNMQRLLRDAYTIRDEYKRDLIQKRVEFAQDVHHLDYSSSDEDDDIFFTCREEFDLTGLDYLIATSHDDLYKRSLQRLNVEEVQCRALRTKLVGCSSDVEYLGKLVSIRSAFDELTANPTINRWFHDVGHSLGCHLAVCLGHPFQNFSTAYESLFTYVTHTSVYDLQQELAAHRIPVVNFYDVVMDYILLDSFELLADVPSSIVTIIQNRWLSDSFKYSALDSAIWTLVLAKKRMLQKPDGFFALYYDLVGTFLCPLTWGFFGPDPKGNRLCNRFRDALKQFVIAVFKCHQKKASKSDDETEADNSMFDESTPVVEDGERELSWTEGQRLQSVGVRYLSVQSLSYDLLECCIAIAEYIHRLLNHHANQSQLVFPSDVPAMPPRPVNTFLASNQ